jgi:EmrB/QacA subfamily drug resistance transporter
LDQAVIRTPRAAVERRGMVLAAALMATAMTAIESTIVATAMPTIVGDLGGFRLFSWVFAAYLLTMAVTVPIYGRLADIYGRKRVFFAGTGIFLVGTTLCGFARTMPLLVAFRGLQGIGAGAIQPIASTVIGDIYTPTERARVQGYSSSVFGVAAIVGPALGAFIVQHLHWAIVFWVNLPVGAASVAMFAAFLPERIERRPHRIDYAGALLLIVSVGAPMLALVQARSLADNDIAVLVGLGLAAFVALALHEARIPEPMVPFRLWRDRVIALANIGIFGTGAAMMSVSAFLPTYVQGVMGKSPAMAGLALGAMSVSWMFASFGAGRLMIRTSYRLASALGGAALVAGAVILTGLEPASGVFRAAAGAFVMGIGMGSCNTSFLVSIQASVEWSERGAATGANMFMRMIGQSFGAALGGAVLNFGIYRRLPQMADAVNQLLQPELRRGLSGADIARLADAVSASLNEVFLIAAAIAVLTLIVSLCFPAGLSPRHPVEPRRAGGGRSRAD